MTLEDFETRVAQRYFNGMHPRMDISPAAVVAHTAELEEAIRTVVAALLQS
jgi:hypothetical protein